MSKFKIGKFRFEDTDPDKAEEIHITKITPQYVFFHIVDYHGCNYSLDDVKFRRKIFTDEYGGQEIKRFYYVWNTIFTPTARQLDSDSGFDTLLIYAMDLIEIKNELENI